MAIYVNTNVSALNGLNKLNNATNNLNTTYQRLSSGLRINSAKDDAAGLQISSRLTTQVNGLDQGNRNASDGIALAQTMEGAMDEITSMLQRARTLAVQSSNGTNSAEDRAAMQKEVTALKDEITRIAEQTTFGGRLILASVNKATHVATAGELTFHVGANQDDVIALDLSSSGFSADALMETATAGDAFNVGTRSQAEQAITDLDLLIKEVDSRRADLGALQNRLESTIRNQSNVSQNTADARSRIRDTDFAAESANLTQQNIIQQAASSMLMQANMRPQIALSLLG